MDYHIVSLPTATACQSSTLLATLHDYGKESFLSWVANRELVKASLLNIPMEIPPFYRRHLSLKLSQQPGELLCCRVCISIARLTDPLQNQQVAKLILRQKLGHKETFDILPYKKGQKSKLQQSTLLQGVSLRGLPCV